MRVAAPQGTSGAHTTSRLPLREASNPVMCPGLSGGVMSTRTLVANTVGDAAASFWSIARVIVVSSAVASTSAFAPPASWSTSEDEPSKENFTVTPGWSFSKPVAMAGNAWFSDAAANTTRVSVDWWDAQELRARDPTTTTDIRSGAARRPATRRARLRLDGLRMGATIACGPSWPGVPWCYRDRAPGGGP